MVDDSGRVVVTGTKEFGDGDRDSSIIRYRLDGERDTGFGTAEPGERPAQGYAGSASVFALDLFLSPSQRLMGSFAAGSAVTAAYLPSGTLDSDYGEQGLGIADRESAFIVEDAASGADGSTYFVATDPILSSGNTVGITAFKVNPDGQQVEDYHLTQNSLILPRDSHTDGSPGIPADHRVVAAVDPQDRLVIGTTVRIGASWRNFFVLRLTAGGELDTTFSGGDGSTQLPSTVDPAKNYVLNDIEVGPDGLIYVLGKGVGGNTATTYDPLFRLRADGEQDTAWSGSLGRRHEGAIGEAFTFQKGAGAGKIIVAGRATSNGVAVDGDLRLKRLDSVGDIDPTFDGADRFRRFGSAPNNVLDLEATANGKLLLTGKATLDANRSEGFVARYLLDGPGAVAGARPAAGDDGPPAGRPVAELRRRHLDKLTDHSHDHVGPRAAQRGLQHEPRLARDRRDRRELHAAERGPRLARALPRGRDQRRRRGDRLQRVQARRRRRARQPARPGRHRRPDRQQQADLRHGRVEQRPRPEGPVDAGRPGDLRGHRQRNYTLETADRAHRVACRVTAANDVGAAAAAVTSERPARRGLRACQRVAPDRDLAVGRAEADRLAGDLRSRAAGSTTTASTTTRGSARGRRSPARPARPTTRRCEDLGRSIACVVFSTNPVGRSRAARSGDVLVPLPAGGVTGEDLRGGRLQPVRSRPACSPSRRSSPT